MSIRRCSRYSRTYFWHRNGGREEQYSLTDQIRRASRSIGANIAESWAKRRYPAHFVSKLTDADGEAQETSHWLATAAACAYLGDQQYVNFQTRIEAVGSKLGKMISKPEAFAPRF